MSAQSRGLRSPAGTPPDPRAMVADFGAHFMAAENPLDAELLAASLLEIPHRYGGDPRAAAMFVSMLIDTAGNDPGPGAAALLRAVAAVAPPAVRRHAVAALGRVTGAGHYPPDWAARIGRAEPGQAWRRHDVYEDTETIAVTYSYGDSAHAVLVQVDRCREPSVIDAMVVGDVTALRSTIEADDDPLVRVEPLGLAQARARMTAALARDDLGERTDLNDRTLSAAPIARARLRRLPQPAPEDLPGARRYDAADRAAAVADFLASPQAGEAGDEKVARYWAEVITGYSAWLDGDPPARIGPRKLSQLLYAYVPNSFALTDEQRRGMPAAVTAWTRWAAARQQLEGPALTRLDSDLSELVGGFDEAYDDPDNAQLRGYLADISATTSDAAVLSEALNRRALAVPPPSERGDETLRRLDAADPDNRRAVLASEFGDCQPPDGMSQPEFLAAVVEVSEQLWRDDPPELWQRAQRLSGTGTSNHDILHRLVAG